ncbi:MAG: T9SS type A sorting domain-containing protein, partial [Hymenobacter sp.]
ANRVTTYGTTPAFQRQAETRPLLRLSLGLGGQPATVATAQDETFVYFEQGATAGVDGQYDAYKLANPSGYYLSTASADAQPTDLSIDGRAPLAAGTTTTIPVRLSVPAGAYSLTATSLLNFASLNGGTGVYLRDALTGTLINLATTPSYSFSVAAGAASTGRFTLIFGTATPLATTSAALRQAVASLYPNPTEASEVTLTITGLPADVRSLDATLTDALGRPVGHYTLPASQGAARTSLPTQALASGLYLLQLAPHDAQGTSLGTLPIQRLSVR